MPFLSPFALKDYAALALIALAIYIAWDWQRQRTARAAEAATYAANLQTSQNNLEASNGSIRRLYAERASTERALAVADAARNKAEARYDASADKIARLERQSPEARAFMDCRMPDDLYRCLRDNAACPDENRDQGAVAASAPGRTTPGPSTVGTGRAGRGRGVEEDRARAGGLQWPRSSAGGLDSRPSRGGA